jgi:uncharacterized membrane protein
MWYWWLFLSVAIFNIVAIKVQPVLKPIEYFSVIVSGLFISEIHDRWTDKSENIYGFFTEHVMEWQTFVIIIGIYPAATYLILTWFPYNKSLLKQTMYILKWTVFSVLFELSYRAMGYEYFSGKWNIWFSAIYYPPGYVGLFLILKFVKYLERKGLQQ